MSDRKPPRTSADEKATLVGFLDYLRDAIAAKVAGVPEPDVRTAGVQSGTNLLGLVKHLASLEYGYLGEVFGRPAPERLSWMDDGTVAQGADMWVAAGETTEYIVGLYRRAGTHADATIAAVGLDDVGAVPWWPEGKREATLRQLILRMIGETARHAGHADIVRELIDGRAGPDHDDFGDEEVWRTYLARIEAAADAFAPRAPGPS